MDTFSALFQEGGIGTMRLKNRLLMAPMGTGIADREGNVNERVIDYYRARARGGVGLVVTQSFFVDAEDSIPYDLALYDDRFIDGIAGLVAAVHEEGARIALQVMHWGPLLVFTGMLPEGMAVKVPSVTSWMTGGKRYEEVKPAEIEVFIEEFGEAARRARDAGADGVELHACHNCLVGSFSSPHTNHRNDDYGGTVENRARFARRTIERMKEKAGAGFPVWVRINGRDGVEGGVTLDEMLQQATILEKAGADAISVSAGQENWSGITIPCYPLPEGMHVPLAEAVKRVVSVPVITAGKIRPELAEGIVRDGRADFVALGRPLLADPELPNKLREGRSDDVRSCLYCNNCLRQGRGRCSVNPFLYREGRLPLKPASPSKRVMVIGGGIAGMHAAVLLAERGHTVSLYEKEDRLGGQWNTVCAVPGKEGFASFLDYLTRALARCGVSPVLGREVSRADVLEESPDAVVVATGATPRLLNVPGVHGKNVVQAVDVINGVVEVGQRVVVIGGRLIGMEVAISMAEQGKRVSLVTRAGLGQNGGPLETYTYRTVAGRLVELGVPLYVDASVLEITGNGVVFQLGDGAFTLAADTVVLAVGTRAENGLVKDLEGTVPELYVIGDCSEPHDAAAASYDAAKVALKV